MSVVQPCSATPSGERAPRKPSGRPGLGSLLAVAAALLLAGCAGEVDTHGDIIQSERLARIVPQQHTQRDVLAQRRAGIPSPGSPRSPKRENGKIASDLPPRRNLAS